jgi:hypothetical protein
MVGTDDHVTERDCTEAKTAREQADRLTHATARDLKHSMHYDDGCAGGTSDQRQHYTESRRGGRPRIVERVTKLIHGDGQIYRFPWRAWKKAMIPLDLPAMYFRSQPLICFFQRSVARLNGSEGSAKSDRRPGDPPSACTSYCNLMQLYQDRVPTAAKASIAAEYRGGSGFLDMGLSG